MEAKDIVMIVAVIAGPILAVQVQKYLETLREHKLRKLRIFQTLMSTRAARLSSDHVQALNMIDIEFYGKKWFWWHHQTKQDRGIIDKWKIYNDHLNTKYDKDQLHAWVSKSDELFIDMLYSMSIALDYNFDLVQLKRSCYSPIAHGEIEKDQETIRAALAKILSGEAALPMKVVSFPSSQEALDLQMEVQQALIKQIYGEIPLKVHIENQGGRDI